MYFRMISPRGLFVFFTSTIGSVIPTFSVYSSIVLFILVLYIVPQSYKDIDLLKHIISASPLVKSHLSIVGLLNGLSIVCSSL